MVKILEQKFSLQVPSSTRNLAMIRDFVHRVAEQAGMEETERNQLELAVDEACSNVIEHAYGHDHHKEVTVRAMTISHTALFNLTRPTHNKRNTTAHILLGRTQQAPL